jgi:hypothetical protein
MRIEIPRKIADNILKTFTDYFGIICDQGAVVGERQLVFVYEKDKTYLCSMDEFEQKGVLIRLKKCKRRRK